jgi:hypothetical protein
MDSKALRLASLILTTIALAAALAHLFEMPNKMKLSYDEYLVVQRIYRGWALIGIAPIGALLATAALAWKLRAAGRDLYLPLTATVCIAASLAVFFAFTYPTNVATENWTVLPAENWTALRRQWEYSHATAAGLYFAAFLALAVSMLQARPAAAVRRSHAAGRLGEPHATHL